MSMAVIKFSQVTTGNFHRVLRLYMEAFPPEERRDEAGLKQQLTWSACQVKAIEKEGQFAGLCIFWEFDDFLFVEHLATEPSLRGQGIGEGVMDLLRNQGAKPVLLEVEPPENETSRRRIGFYMRNGFFLLDKEYWQPSYDFIRPDLPLNLMCTQKDPGELRLDQWIGIVKEKVYGRDRPLKRQ